MPPNTLGALGPDACLFLVLQHRLGGRRPLDGIAAHQRPSAEGRRGEEADGDDHQERDAHRLAHPGRLLLPERGLARDDARPPHAAALLPDLVAFEGGPPRRPWAALPRLRHGRC